ncbi:MAG: SpoVG family protein [Planctomycetota bacterium]
MEITEVRIKLMDEPGERLKAFCSITFDDCFVVRDLKIIEGANGPFVAMPSRKLTAHCSSCRAKNHLRAAYCNHCGSRLRESQAAKDEEGRAKLYADIAHPINSSCREMIQNRVIDAFGDETEKAKTPGYVSSYEDFDSEHTFPEEQPGPSAAEPQEAPKPEQPRGPHKTPSRQPQDSHRPRKGGDFGAGVFD